MDGHGNFLFLMIVHFHLYRRDYRPHYFQVLILRFDPQTGGFANTMKKRWPQPRWRYEKRDLGKTIADLVRKYQSNQAIMMSPTSI